MVFYRKYRPQKFVDLVGQDHIRDMLLAQLKSGNIGHGYLFAGPRGTGKTTTARIFAKAVNCQKKLLTTDKGQLTKKSQMSDVSGQLSFGEPCNRCLSCTTITDGSYLDLVEIDAASNRGIDEIRDLREKIKLSPISGRFKVYIIDEAHMLTVDAFNALLKTLEEPPTHAIFILATTAPAKLPATIVSRLSRYNFQRAKNEDIITAVKKVAREEKISIDEEALGAIAKAADGSFRDAISILDQLAALGRKITLLDVSKTAVISGELVYDFIKSCANFDLRQAVICVEKLTKTEGDISSFAREVVNFLEKVLIYKIGADEVTGESKVLEFANLVNFSQLQQLLKLFLTAEGEAALYPSAHIPLLLAAAKYCGPPKASLAISGEPQVSQSKSKVDLSQKGNSRVMPTAIGSEWEHFLTKVKPVNANLVAILRATKPMDFDGESLTLVAFYRFHKDRLEEPKVIGLLEQILAEVFSRKIRLRVKLADRGEKPPRVVEESDLVEAAPEDLTAVAAEIFSK